MQTYSDGALYRRCVYSGCHWHGLEHEHCMHMHQLHSKRETPRRFTGLKVLRDLRWANIPDERGSDPALSFANPILNASVIPLSELSTGSASHGSDGSPFGDNENQNPHMFQARVWDPILEYARSSQIILTGILDAATVAAGQKEREWQLGAPTVSSTELAELILQIHDERTDFARSLGWVDIPGMMGISEIDDCPLLKQFGGLARCCRFGVGIFSKYGDISGERLRNPALVTLKRGGLLWVIYPPHRHNLEVCRLLFEKSRRLQFDDSFDSLEDGVLVFQKRDSTLYMPRGCISFAFPLDGCLLYRVDLDSPVSIPYLISDLSLDFIHASWNGVSIEDFMRSTCDQIAFLRNEPELHYPAVHAWIEGSETLNELIANAGGVDKSVIRHIRKAWKGTLAETTIKTCPDVGCDGHKISFLKHFLKRHVPALPVHPIVGVTDRKPHDKPAEMDLPDSFQALIAAVDRNSVEQNGNPVVPQQLSSQNTKGDSTQTNMDHITPHDSHKQNHKKSKESKKRRRSTQDGDRMNESVLSSGKLGPEPSTSIVSPSKTKRHKRKRSQRLHGSDPLSPS